VCGGRIDEDTRSPLLEIEPAYRDNNRNNVRAVWRRSNRVGGEILMPQEITGFPQDAW
jgi:hypothetical protein